MVGGRVDMTGINLARRREAARMYTITDMQDLSAEFEARVWAWLDQMWQGRGKVPGPYGKGTKKWARNAPSTVKKKGFDDPLHSSPGHSSIKEQGYKFNAWHQRRGGGDSAMARFRLWAERYRGTVNYALVNHLGSAKRKIPARPHQGFPPGATKMLKELAAQRGLTSRGWRAGSTIGRMAKMLTRNVQQAGQTVQENTREEFDE